MNAVFDVGADDGFHVILFAFVNPKINVFAFEPIKGSKKNIIGNLKKIEKFFGIKIKNYKIINNAISDFNGYTTFYETKYRVGSSLLKPKKKLNEFWTKSEDFLIKTVARGMKIKKKYKVKVLTLEKFCKINSIKIINYLHIDAQGHDLRVIKSLKKYRKCLIEGVAEVPKNNKLRIYDHEQTKLKKSQSETRKNQVGTGDRSERIRTYNFPQGRVTDHRINLTLHKLEQVLSGESLDEIIDKLLAEDKAIKLANLN